MVAPEYDSHANFLCRSIYRNKKNPKKYKRKILVNSKSLFLFFIFAAVLGLSERMRADHRKFNGVAVVSELLSG